MARLSDEKEEIYVKALISGESGDGKSSFGATAPRPLIVLSEKQGRISARKRAAELGRGQPTIVEVDSLQDYRDLLRSMKGSKDEPFRWVDQSGAMVVEMNPWPESIVLDSLTDACQLVEEDILRDAPPKKGEDGLPVFSQRHWAELKKRCHRLFRAFRDVPAHVVFLCILEERVTETSDGRSTRSIGPSLPMRKLPDLLMQATNVAGIIRRSVKRLDDGKKDLDDDNQTQLVFEVYTSGPSMMKVKQYRPLRDVENADFSDWVERVRAAAPEERGEVAA